MNTEQELELLELQASLIRKRMAELRTPIPEPDTVVIIEFDGGTSCNIPAKGFGRGYGSYQIGDQDIVRVEFGIGHSCNSAEIRTANAALLALSKQTDPSSIKVLLRGDSKIALKWSNPNERRIPKQSSTPKFLEAIREIREVNRRFKSLKTEWRTRLESVRIFGH